MKHSTTSFRQKHKRLRELGTSDKSFNVKQKHVRRWFDILNSTIFGGKLPYFDKVTIKHIEDAHAHFYYYASDRTKETELCITRNFDNKKQFVEILCHEMIHLFQYLYDEPMGHGPSFWIWQDNLNLKGLTLHKAL